MTRLRWHWTGHVSVATHADCALVEHVRYDWPDGLMARPVSTYTIDVVRDRAAQRVEAGTSREARVLAVAAAERLRMGVVL